MPQDRPGSHHEETVSLDRETVLLNSPADPAGAPADPAGAPAATGAEAPTEVTSDPWGQPAAAPFVLADPSAVPSFDGPPEAPASKRRLGVLVALAAVLAVAVLGGVVLVSGVFGSEERTASGGSASPSAASPAASPSVSPAGPSGATPSAAAPSPAVPSAAAPVPAGPRPVAAWSVDGGRGDAETGGRDLTASNVTAAGGSGAFNGRNSQLTTPGAVLDTAPRSSFTVAASVFLVNTEGYQTAVSQDGAVNSAFFLQYSSAEKKWAFSRVAGDTPNAAGTRALSTAPAKTMTWVRLVGVFDAKAAQLRLYVDGAPQGTAKYAAAFASKGEFAVGRAKFNGRDADWFRGNIDNVKVYDSALTAAEVASL
ncbi:LamG domain-containing protein [Cryptosporangium arvum]|uniref:LamG domain-containing protein n=1 Tax=Cryptosporangium arvum TaxID=80871 RepID=UPI000685F0C3|nr:LamG domain-containing protein [Cryptosporangium arvum]